MIFMSHHENYFMKHSSSLATSYGLLTESQRLLKDQNLSHCSEPCRDFQCLAYTAQPGLHA